jgi:hypothetical protein
LKIPEISLIRQKKSKKAVAKIVFFCFLRIFSGWTNYYTIANYYLQAFQKHTYIPWSGCTVSQQDDSISKNFEKNPNILAIFYEFSSIELLISQLSEKLAISNKLH